MTGRVTSPSVSIAIPTYSRPHYLRQTVAAILASTADLEIVVGDDGDQGRAVCEEINDPRVRYIANPRRLGMAGNWTSTLDACRGRYLGLCMDDDLQDPEFLPLCLRVFEQDPDVDVVFSNHRFLRADESQTVRVCAVAPGKHVTFEREFISTFPVAVSAAIFRAEMWQVVRPLPDTAAADVVLFGRIAAAAGTFYYLDRPLMSYRVHDAMLSSTPEFRADCALAWGDIRLRDPVADQLRTVRHAEALRSLARSEILAGRRADAREHVREARALSSRPGADVTIGLLSALPAPMALLNRSARLWRSRPGLRRQGPRDA